MTSLLPLLLLSLGASAASPWSPELARRASDAEGRCDLRAVESLVSGPAAAGSPLARLYMLRARERLARLEPRPREIEELYDQAAAVGEPVYMLMKAWRLKQAGRDAEARALYLKLRAAYDARAGEGDPQLLLAAASAFSSGNAAESMKIPADDAKAARYLARAKALLMPKAEAGDPRAQGMLGALYYQGTGASSAELSQVDYAQARRWFKKAADAGDAPSMYRLATLYWSDHGGPVESDKALELLRRASADYCLSLTSLSTQYAATVFMGRRGHQPEIEPALGYALEYERRGGTMFWVCNAAFALDNPYSGVPQDPSRAAALIKPRAEAGEPYCQKTLAKMYWSGHGVPQDEAEGVKWFVLGGGKDSELPALKPDVLREGRQRAAAFERVPRPADAPETVESALKAYAALSGAPAPLAAAPAAAPAPEEPSEPGVDSPSRRAAKDAPHDFALIVGIEHYKDLPAADYAERDAQAVRANLRALGVPDRNMISLTGDQATRSKLQAYLEEWLPKNVKAESRVFFYYSGHGSPDAATGQAFLIPADGDPAFLKSTAYPLADVYAALAKLPAKQVVVALDSCFRAARGPWSRRRTWAPRPGSSWSSQPRAAISSPSPTTRSAMEPSPITSSAGSRATPAARRERSRRRSWRTTSATSWRTPPTARTGSRRPSCWAILRPCCSTADPPWAVIKVAVIKVALRAVRRRPIL